MLPDEKTFKQQTFKAFETIKLLEFECKQSISFNKSFLAKVTTMIDFVITLEDELLYS